LNLLPNCCSLIGIFRVFKSDVKSDVAGVKTRRMVQLATLELCYKIVVPLPPHFGVDRPILSDVSLDGAGVKARRILSSTTRFGVVFTFDSESQKEHS
jgi:hypothetical protein